MLKEGRKLTQKTTTCQWITPVAIPAK